MFQAGDECFSGFLQNIQPQDANHLSGFGDNAQRGMSARGLAALPGNMFTHVHTADAPRCETRQGRRRPARSCGYSDFILGLCCGLNKSNRVATLSRCAKGHLHAEVTLVRGVGHLHPVKV